MNILATSRRQRPARLSTARAFGWLVAASLVLAATLGPGATTSLAGNGHANGNGGVGQGNGNAGDSGSDNAPGNAGNNGENGNGSNASDTGNGNDSGNAVDNGHSSSDNGNTNGQGAEGGSSAQVDKNPTCQDRDASLLQLEIDGSALTNGPYSADGLTVTISSATSTSFDWASDAAVAAVVVKGGQGGYSLYPGGTSGFGLTTPNNPNGQPAGISHVEFCYTRPTTPPATDDPSNDPSTPPTDQPTIPPATDNPSNDPSTPPTDQPTTQPATDNPSTDQPNDQSNDQSSPPADATTTPPVTDNQSNDRSTPPAIIVTVQLPQPSASPAPIGEVAGVIGDPVTNGPTLTLPPTDTISPHPAAPSSVPTWRLLLLGLAALIASLLVLPPERALGRRRS